MPSKKKDRRDQYLALPTGQVMDAIWIMRAVLGNPRLMEAVTREAVNAGFGRDMVENTEQYFSGITEPSRDADDTRAELTEQYIDTRTEDVIRDILGGGDVSRTHERVESEVRGLVKELAGRLAPQEMKDEIADIDTSTPD